MTVRQWLRQRRTAIGVDIQPAATCIESLNRQVIGRALRRNIAKNSLNTLLVKLLVLTVSNQIFEQANAIYLMAAVNDMDTAPIRLRGNRTKRTQQMAI